jgi:hypothetical protein
LTQDITKNGSSEIAQSRRDWFSLLACQIAERQGLEQYSVEDGLHVDPDLIAAMVTMAESTERDLRERLAKQVSEIQPIPELIPADKDEGHTYKVGFFDALRSGAERIRGKE